MKRLYTIIVTMLCMLSANAQIVGADVSWCTEMEASGKEFYNAAGQETDLMNVLKEMGMNAIRLRVWVNPSYSTTASTSCYGSAYCDKADVVAKAKRAKDAGLDIMIDFHYSDFFTDPSRQNKPNEWTSKTLDELKTAVADHTKDVLNALKTAGVTPKWIQIGNETRNGMLWPEGMLWTDTEHAPTLTNPGGWAQFTALYMAGYNAAKEVFTTALVMPHLNHAYEDNTWWFDKLKENNGKFDMIALSHYPQTDDTSKSTATMNANAATQVAALKTKYGVDVMISEFGVKEKESSTTAQSVVQDFCDKIKNVSGYAGVFYWEPELYNWWKPAAYTTLGWGSYNMGAFWDDGKPSDALKLLVNNLKPTAINEVHTSLPMGEGWGEALFNLAGQQVDKSYNGIIINNGKKILK